MRVFLCSQVEPFHNILVLQPLSERCHYVMEQTYLAPMPIPEAAGFEQSSYKLTLMSCSATPLQ